MVYTLNIGYVGAPAHKIATYKIQADNYDVRNEVITFYFNAMIGNNDPINVASFGLRDTTYSVTTDSVTIETKVVAVPVPAE